MSFRSVMLGMSLQVHSSTDRPVTGHLFIYNKKEKVLKLVGQTADSFTIWIHTCNISTIQSRSKVIVQNYKTLHGTSIN